MPPRSILTFGVVLVAALAVIAWFGGRAAATSAAGERPDGLTERAWTQIQHAVAEDRRAIRPGERADTWSAASAAGGTTATFAADGTATIVASRSAGEEPAQFAMRLAGWGWRREATTHPAMHPAPDVSAVQVDGHRLAFLREGITEWYENRPAGLMHGFTIPEAPLGRDTSADGWLIVRLQIDGSLQPEVTGNGRDLLLRDAEGDVRLRYDGLVSWDATGRDLPARMRVAADGQVQIAVAADAAEFPIVIDPTISTQQAKLTASDGAGGDWFGFSVAVDRDTAVVGAALDGVGGNASQGSVYVFTRSSGSWTQQQKLTASDGAASDWFGRSVAMSGDTAVVGAPFDDDNGTDSGSAYVFTRSSGSWTQQQKLTAPDGAASDRFGISVAVDGDTAVVGAYLDTIGGDREQGSAYVFTRSGGSWTQQQKLTASDGAAGD